jgi:hypothetical protein
MNPLFFFKETSIKNEHLFLIIRKKLHTVSKIYFRIISQIFLKLTMFNFLGFHYRNEGRRPMTHSSPK